MNPFAKKVTTLFAFLFLVINLPAQVKNTNEDLYRPRIHFTPAANWMNDPNGMVFYNGVYHLFYQHNPGAPVWGPMHWGHATSKDLIHWEHLPIGIYPDSLGTIFSGSAVVDINNTSGFGKGNQIPLVAIYTQHNMDGEKAGRDDYQNQSISVSLDEAKTWKTYAGNPVIKTPHLKDFRDPKVFWYAPNKSWIMSLAVGPNIEFYSSPNLKSWKKESQVGGAGMGVHDGNWECPDLVSFDDHGKKVWVLIVNVNPGAPNKGSGTQYFIGDFDGHKFTPLSRIAKWLDYGPDNYAGVTWSNTGSRTILAGWMSNWLYANTVPTEKWRNGLTIPRDLSLVKIENEYRVASKPIIELDKLAYNKVGFKNIKLAKPFVISDTIKNASIPCRIDLSLLKSQNIELILSNNIGEQLIIGFNAKANHYFIDRTKAGRSEFYKEFAAVHTAPRFSIANKMDMSLVIDVASVELFADGGLSVMTEIFFPTEAYSKFELRSSDKTMVDNFTYTSLKSIL
jgi:fructan beta-fructosidase